MITFFCNQCGKRFSMADELAGRQGRCKKCGATITVPAASTARPSTSGTPAQPAAPPHGIQHPPPAPPIPAKKRLSVRGRRLAADAAQMAAAFRNLSLIQIRETAGNPPEIYRIQYNIRGLVRGAGGQPIVRQQHLVEIQLTREYPRQSPKCKMLTPIFHPNIEPAMICVGDHWTAGERLVDLVVRIGEMIAYQAFNIKSPLDGEAAMWADLNGNHLPIDPRNLHPADK